MAIVRRLEHLTLSKDTKHTEVDSTYSIVNAGGETFLQIDTYGSEQRKTEGKSQSIRLSKEAILQLFDIVNKNKLV